MIRLFSCPTGVPIPPTILLIIAILALGTGGCGSFIPSADQGGIAATELPSQQIADRLIPVDNDEQRRLRLELLVAVIADAAVHRVENGGSPDEAGEVMVFVGRMKRSAAAVADPNELWFNTGLFDLKVAVIKALAKRDRDDVKFSILDAFDLDGVLGAVERVGRIGASIRDVADIMLRVRGNGADPPDLTVAQARDAALARLTRAEARIKVLADAAAG